jgi:hypothetical protein
VKISAAVIFLSLMLSSCRFGTKTESDLKSLESRPFGTRLFRHGKLQRLTVVKKDQDNFCFYIVKKDIKQIDQEKGWDNPKYWTPAGSARPNGFAISRSALESWLVASQASCKLAKANADAAHASLCKQKLDGSACLLDKPFAKCEGRRVDDTSRCIMTQSNGTCSLYDTEMRWECKYQEEADPENIKCPPYSTVNVLKKEIDRAKADGSGQATLVDEKLIAYIDALLSKQKSVLQSTLVKCE